MNAETLADSYPDYDGQIEHVATIPARDAETVPAAEHLPSTIADGLGHDLYTHQAEALDRLADGEDICVATSTASGKTLIYALDIARRTFENPHAKALLVYPTKALSSDQQAALTSHYDDLGLAVDVGRYDGDTSTEEKRRIREEADVIITNFAGLNQYLAHHPKWSNVLADLELLVIDEAHSYTGISGMHVAWIVRRLLRIAASDRYGSDPQLVLTSATIGNPAVHARRLTGREVTVVDDDGSPRGRREIVFWNPPTYVTDGGVTARRSTHLESSRILAHLTSHGIQTLLFAPSRKMTELDATWTDERFSQTYDSDRPRIEPYHAGHTKAERQEVERGLKDGTVDGVVSTTALEVGIDVGTMDATVLSGYPGSRTSFWQQLGRSGRGTSEALGVLVAQHSSLDQYVVANPDSLLEDDIEDAIFDLENNPIYMQHVFAAAEELPLTASDTATFGDRLAKVVQVGSDRGELTGELRSQVQFAGRGRPQDRISLYGTTGEAFEVRIRDDDGVRTIDRIDHHRAYRDFHPGAVSLHRGQQYEIATFDETKQPAEIVLEPTSVDYYTQASREVEIRDLSAERTTELDRFRLCWGRGTVSVSYPSYQEHSIYGTEIYGPFSTGLTDPVELHTKLLWIEIADEHSERVRRTFPTRPADGSEAQDPFLGGVHAAEHALIKLTPTELLIDARDLGGLSTDRHPETETACLFVYDGAEGGLGFTRSMYENLESLCRRTARLVETCDCPVRGCPGCVMDYQCGNDNWPMHTDAAVTILTDLLAAIEERQEL